jgi:hypothetical protein
VGSLDLGIGSIVQQLGVTTARSEELVARKISELLENSRALLLQLGDTELDNPNPIRALQRQFPDDLTQPWPTWSFDKVPLDDENTSGSGIIK